LKLLAIETSCDETSAAVTEDNKILSNIISSQLFHKDYGGIVPELASRAQLTSIDFIVNEAITKSNTDKSSIDYVAATQGPGLIGSLLVGYNFGKAFSVMNNKKFLGINHIESHLYSPFIGQKEISFPFLGLIVSGGHTLLILVKDYFEYELLGTTQDDAAGEAFDKTAKLLGLSYPGGPMIDKLAKEGDENFHSFPVAQIKDNPYDFSFSGIKTSVLYYMKKNYPDINSAEIPLNNICASFQKAVVESLTTKTMEAAKKFNVKSIAVSGGVSMNSKLRSEFSKFENSGYKIFFPQPGYTTDNAAMIGYTAYLKIQYSDINKTDSLFSAAFARFDYNNF